MHFDKIDKKDFQKTNRISRKYNMQWKKYADRPSIGDCSNLFQRLRPTDYYDFYLKYTKDGEETVHNREVFKHCGRTEEEIEEVARKYMAECGNTSFTFEDFVKNVYMHTIIETYDGQTKEQDVNQILANLGYTYEKPEKEEDSRFGIDFKVYKDGKLVFVLQIKPISFFLGSKNYSLIQDRIGAFEKQSLVMDRLHVPTYYMVYKADDNGNVGWLTENGKLCFELKRLCNQENGLPYELPNEFMEL